MGPELSTNCALALFMSSILAWLLIVEVVRVCSVEVVVDGKLTDAGDIKGGVEDDDEVVVDCVADADADSGGRGEDEDDEGDGNGDGVVDRVRR